MRRGLLVAALAAGLLAAPAGPASASFHEMVVQEVFPGSAANPNQDYVTLQMYSPGQNLVGGHTLTVYKTDGDVADTATFATPPSPPVPNGASQSTILIGAASTVVGATPDLVDAGLAAMDPAGGAVCWAGVECVAWGTFTPPIGGLPSEAGTLAASPGGIGDGLVLEHKTGEHGCSTLLEAVDDTNVSNDDFAFSSPAPRNNASTPTELACPDTRITKGPTGRTHDRTPTFKFKSIPGGAPTLFCAIDDQELFDTCESPFKVPKQSFGKHSFFVMARNSVGGHDLTPAERKFKVVKKH